MRCPKCKNHVLQKSGRRTRLRTKGQIVFEDGICASQCYWCGSVIEIPLEIVDGTSVIQEKFILRQES
jgi:hypothetical protein